MRSRFAILAAGLLSLAGVQQAQAGIVIDYPSFAAACNPGSGLTCVGNTSVAGTSLRLTPSAPGQAGAGYSTTAITLGAGATFSTTFQFRFTQTGGIDPADGITFVVSKATSGLGAAGGGLGYQGVGNSVAVEFDTYNNGEVGHSNHVAVDVNGVLNNFASANPYGQVDCTTGNNIRQGCMSNGDIWSATINYDGTTQLLDVFLQDGAGAIQHLISGFSIDLGTTLGTTDAFVGFTAGTGAGYENQDILNWRLANDTSLGNPNHGVPEPASLALLALAGGAALSARRRRA
jgi:hypothetical protein